MMKLHISAGAFILLAALVLLLPLQWVVAMIVAAFVHEGCHALVVYITGGEIRSVTIGGRGITIFTEPMSGFREILCAIAGPLGSLSLLLWARWIPRTAVCGLIHGAYNLLPLLPLDGGRVLRGFLQILLPPPAAAKGCLWSQRCVRVLLVLVLLFLVIKIGGIAVILGIFLLAKKSFWRYNRNTIDKGERL